MKLRWPVGLGDRIKNKAVKQYPNEDKGSKLRRAVINIETSSSAHLRIPMPDYAEIDLDRRPMIDLNQNLNWILLNTFFAISFFFLVPGLIFAVCLAAILDNYFYLQNLMYFARCPESWFDTLSSSKLQAPASSSVGYSQVPSIAAASRSFNLSIPLLSLPFTLVYYSNHVDPWFPTLLHHILFLVAIEHVLVLLHWAISQATEAADRNIAEQAARSEDSFSRSMKRLAEEQQAEADQRAKLELAVRQEQDKWSAIVDKTKHEGDSHVHRTEKERLEVFTQFELATKDLRSHWFQPKTLRANLQFSIYWSIEQYLLSKRMETLTTLVPTPICEENTGYLIDEFISVEECPDFVVKVCADDHEKIALPVLESKAEDAELTLTEYLVLREDQEYKSKFELYHRKDKLKDLLEEYLRRKGEEEFLAKARTVSFWVKLEKCEARIDNLESAFDVFKDMYSRFIGFREGVEESETNPNIILQVETLGESKGLDKQLDSLLSYYRIETLLFLNRIFYHGALLSLEGAAFVQEDFKRMCSAMNPASHISQQIYLLFIFAGFTGRVNLATVERLFLLSGVRDLLPKRSLRSILFEVIKKEGDLTKGEIKDIIERANESEDFKKVVAALFK